MLSPDQAVAELPRLMAALASEMRATLESQAGAQVLAAPELPPHDGEIVWTNTIVHANQFRRGHVELFSVPNRFAVVHMCIFPHISDPASIFGFDMITGRDVATGVFLDYSLPGHANPLPDLRDVLSDESGPPFHHHRTKPIWGTVFSDSMLAIRPTDPAELHRALELARKAATYYLAVLGQARPAQEAVAHDAQTRYVLAQRRNEHTLRMLSRFTGAEAARAFIETVLFPLPPSKATSPQAKPHAHCEMTS